MNQHIVTIALGIGLLVVAAYLIVMRVFFRESKELDKHIDYNKMKEWKDED